MGKIKSAVELAMEKTSHMTIDKDLLKKKELKKAGQHLASAIINNGEKKGEEKLKSYSPKDCISVKEGFADTIISNIRLPLYIDIDNKLNILKKTFTLISEKEDIYELVFNQLEQLFEKYNEDLQNLLEGLKEQYMPILMQKQQQLMEQTGQNISLEAEQDPEFVELLKKNRSSLENQYNEVINQAKEELRKII